MSDTQAELNADTERFVIEKRDYSYDGVWGRWREVFASVSASEARFELWNLSQVATDGPQPLYRVRTVQLNDGPGGGSDEAQ